MVLTTEERVFLVEQVFRHGGNYTEGVQIEFNKTFPDTPVPHRNAVRNLIRKFRETGSVQDVSRSGRPITSEETVNDVKDRMERSPTKSVRRLSQEADISKSSAHRILRTNLKLYPYKVTVVHQLHEADHEARVDFCTWFQNFINEEGDDILDVTFFTDEAWFHLSGHVNSQNSRMWSSENPQEFKEMPLHDEKIGVWCAISRARLIGPIFFTGTINQERYRIEILQPFLSRLTQTEVETGWFQQDGATAHTAHSSLRFLEETFSSRIISRGLWPARSPDLTPPDFYLWGALKGKVYKNNPHTLEELKAAITINIQEITPDTLRKVFRNLKTRIQTCLTANGGHFQHLL